MTPFYKIESSVMDEMVKMDAELRAENERLRACLRTTTLELEVIRLHLDTALAHIDGAVRTMTEGLRPNLTIPLARQEIVLARHTLDAVLDVLAHHPTPQAGEQEQ